MIKKQKSMNYGAGIVALFVILFFFFIFYRFFSIQLTHEVNGVSLDAMLEDKYNREKNIESKRGTIYDRNGEVIAQDTFSYKLIAILSPDYTGKARKPKHVVDPDMTARELSNYIDLSYEEIYEKLTRINPKTGTVYYQVEFGNAGRDLSNTTKKLIEDLSLPGIQFSTDKKRFYPNGIFASHTIGYVDKLDDEKSTELVGMLGLESSLDDILAGSSGSYSYKSDYWGYLLADANEEIIPAEDGNDVYLTIDKKIQTFLEDAMNQVQEEYEPTKMVAIVASAKTGEILAISQRPTFHPKTRAGISDTWHNEVIETPYEPGSTFKVFTLAAAVNEGVFNATDLVPTGRFYESLSKVTVRDWNNGQGWGNVTYLEGVQRSSNVAFIHLVKDKLGFQRFYEYLQAFQLDQKTGIELPKEKSGVILYNYEIEKVTTAFGQGSTVTPLQQVQAATAIANNGEMLKLQIIDKIINSNTGEVVEDKEKKVISNPISAKTANEVLAILETVITSEKGTGHRQYSIDGYRISGKTGTAQIPNPNGGGYLTGKENHVFSFLGFAPANDPELIIYIGVQQPKLTINQTGAEPVSKVFKTVVKSSLSYLNIKPDDVTNSVKYKLKDYTNKTVESSRTELINNSLLPIVVGNGSKIIGQLPAAGSEMIQNEKVLLLTEGDMTMPNVIGWSLRDVIRFSELTGMQLNNVGTGFVTKQNFSPGSTIVEGDYLIVELESPETFYTEPVVEAINQEEETFPEDFIYD